MNRLTFRGHKGYGLLKGKLCNYASYSFACKLYEGIELLDAALEKLIYYEDLEEQLEEVYGECPDLLEAVVNVLAKHEGFDLGNQIKSKLLTDKTVDTWERWKKEDEEGRLIELPCKVGDTVYVYIDFDNKIFEGKVKSFEYDEVKKCWLAKISTSNGLYYKKINDFGRNIFTSYEDAEKVLKEMEG